MPNITETIAFGFSQKIVVIIGDLVADQFLSGTISRVSREAPVFIMRHEETATLPGAAANAAVNVASLGGTAVLIGFAGTDTNGDSLIDALKNAKVDISGVIKTDEVATTTKVRVLTGQQFAEKNQVIRIDYESGPDISDDLKIRLRAKLAAIARVADGIIISDYNYGAVFPEIYADALEISRTRGVPLVVDSRFRLEQHTGATSGTPNSDEVETILGRDFSQEDCDTLRSRLGYETLLVTNGNKGMMLFEKNCPVLEIPAVGSLSAVDVTGAGDTVIAAYTLGLASGLSFADAAKVANHAGGIVVMKKRTASVSTAELARSLEDNVDAVIPTRAGLT